MASADPRQSMKGRTALISGSSSGIGAAIAQELSSRGANVVLNYPFPSLQQQAEAVGQTLASPWIAVQADLTAEGGPSKLVAEAVARFGHIDILVNNAGLVPMGGLWEASVESWDAAMNLNARGTFLLTKAALPHLTPYTAHDPPPLTGRPGGARIICVGSAASQTPEPEQGVYTATKGAIESMMRVWAKELPPRYGCTVNAVGPGPVNTKVFRDMIADHFEDISGYFHHKVPVEGAFAEPEDVAWAVAWLAESRSKWINGRFIQLDGGAYL